MTIKRAIIQAWNSGPYTADIQITGSLAVFLNGVKVSRDIAGAEMVVGRECAVLFLTESNPQDAIVIAVWA